MAIVPGAHRNPKVIVVMPAYNAELTLEKTFRDIPAGSVDEVILVDDASRDRTVAVARSLGLTVIAHERNGGYGANQKTCYAEALTRGADIVVMVHPDYQYDSRLVPFFTGFVWTGVCDVMLGSRIRTRRETLEGGMPVWKYLSNRILTLVENVFLGQNLGDFHSGFRVYRREVLETIPWQENSNDFVFDSQFLAQAAFFGFRIGDAPVPVRYFREASSINFRRSLVYGFRTVEVLARYGLARLGLLRRPLFVSRPKA
ncbi:MAG: glycosyltransferase family 2 protein [Planctomycetes bacterium]|nr:glycosyltransferase family 2 protein [Planctomycetota bacterium]